MEFVSSVSGRTILSYGIPGFLSFPAWLSQTAADTWKQRSEEMIYSDPHVDLSWDNDDDDGSSTKGKTWFPTVFSPCIFRMDGCLYVSFVVIMSFFLMGNYRI